jgi:hypothetical protein
MFGELEIGGENLLVDLKWVFSILSKGDISSQKLIQYHAQRPEIDIISIALSRKYLRRHISGRTNDSKSLMQGVSVKLLASAQIHNLQIAILGDHDILGFEIAVDNHAGVNGLEHLDHDGSVESWLLKAQQADQPDGVE